MGELSIKVTIGNRVYPLTIQYEEEETVRRAANAINKNMEDLESNYAVRDKQDLLAMTALQFAKTSVEKRVNTSEDDSLIEQLQELEGMISEQLSN